MLGVGEEEGMASLTEMVGVPFVWMKLKGKEELVHQNKD
jgi:hypothetical protein